MLAGGGLLSLAQIWPTNNWEVWTSPSTNGAIKQGLNFELGGKYLDEYFSLVHFNVAGNDFWGGFFWLPVNKLTTPIIITTKDKNWAIATKTCTNQVRGFYYNSQRGERLWPLDADSKKALQRFSPTTYNASLDLKWWWYTSCGKDPFGIYGAITHTYQGETFQLNAGIGYEIAKNKMKSDGLKCNFQRLNNSYPFGYIYDDHGHIGLVGAKVRDREKSNTNKIAQFHLLLNNKLDEGRCISEIFNYDGHEIWYSTTNTIPWFPNRNAINNFLDINPGSAKTTLFNLGIRGIVGFTAEINNEEKSNFEKNNEDQTLLVRTDETISKIVNVARKNANKLCKWKWQPTFWNIWEKILCINWNGNGISKVLEDASNLAGKVVILQDTNLYLNPNQTSDSAPITLFIDRGSLFLPSTTTTGNMQIFDSLWYATNTCNGNQCPRANYLKGNFIINGLLLWGRDGTKTIENKLYIHGKFLSFNTFKQPIEKRITTVKNILGDAHWKDKFKTYIALDNLFTWWCNLDQGSDGTWCKGISKAEREAQGVSSLLIDKAFGLIDMNFDNPLFR